MNVYVMKRLLFLGSTAKGSIAEGFPQAMERLISGTSTDTQIISSHSRLGYH